MLDSWESATEWKGHQPWQCPRALLVAQSQGTASTLENWTKKVLASLIAPEHSDSLFDPSEVPGLLGGMGRTD